MPDDGGDRAAMQRVKGNYPLNVSRIIFSDGTEKEDVQVLLYGSFVIVTDNERERPSIYNGRLVDVMEGVEEIRQQAKISSGW